jgi:hypothetical protein
MLKIVKQVRKGEEKWMSKKVFYHFVDGGQGSVGSNPVLEITSSSFQ